MYISREYLRVFAARRRSRCSAIFYISTFIDLADKLFRGEATTAMLLRYFYFATPQFVYYVIPMAVLVATLVTVGVMTKNSELIVHARLRHQPVPLGGAAACSSRCWRAASLFVLQEQVLASTNREADRLERDHPRLAPSSRRH